MAILVSPLSRVAAIVALHRPWRVVSLLDPEWQFPDLGLEYADRHLRLRFHEAQTPDSGQVVPSVEDVRTLLAFLGAWDSRDSILVHCRAGIGRSTAVAFMAACLSHPGVDERDIAVALRQSSPLARPNEVLVLLADQEMGREGRMYRAIVNTGQRLPPIEALKNSRSS